MTGPAEQDGRAGGQASHEAVVFPEPLEVSHPREVARALRVRTFDRRAHGRRRLARELIVVEHLAVPHDDPRVALLGEERTTRVVTAAFHVSQSTRALSLDAIDGDPRVLG
jgi:hypothetical protein